MQQENVPAYYPGLAGRTVIVTGGASGIGACIVKAFSAQQARVAFLDIQEAAADLLIEQVVEQGGKAPRYYPCDLTDIGALQSSIGEIIDTCTTVDILVNNAGNDTRHTMEEVTPEFWDRCMAVNLKHQFFASQSVVPAMRAAGRGVILNMSSISWTIPSVGVPVYVTAKAAIVGMTRTLAHELGKDNIRVNCILPGAVLTERQKRLWLTEEYKAEILRNQALKRMIVPEEVAHLVLFLASDASCAITNQSFVIDAGWT